MGFLKARGGLSRVKFAKVPKTGPIAMNMVIEEDDQGVLADQRVCPGTWSKNCINRAVLVGTPIYIDRRTYASMYICMHIHIYMHIHICAQPAASVFEDVYVVVKNTPV